MRALSPIAAAAACILWADGAAGQPLTIVALGDSLTAGYQLAPDAGFPAQLEKRLREEGFEDVTVADAGVSGDTTSGGLSRLDWSVGPEADAVIVELGGNDALRGLPPETTRENLTAILDRLEERGLPVLLAGMYAPRNLGDAYRGEFEAVFQELAASRDVIFYEFFLEGVAGDPSLNLPDGIHPTEEGITIIVDNILPDVIALIERARAREG